MLRVSGKRWNLPQVFVEGDLGDALLGVSRNRFPFNVKFEFTIFGPMHSSMVARADSWRFFIFIYFLFSFLFFFFLAFLGPSLFKWFLFPHVKHPLFPFLKAAAIVSATICIF